MKMMTQDEVRLQLGMHFQLGLLRYAETKEMIYESVNLKGVMYEPKQNSFRLQSISNCTGFATADPIFYKAHALSTEQVFE